MCISVCVYRCVCEYRCECVFTCGAIKALCLTLDIGKHIRWIYISGEELLVGGCDLSLGSDNLPI